LGREGRFGLGQCQCPHAGNVLQPCC
jgi:hypothetical protein